MKKTIKIDDLKNRINKYLSLETVTQEEKSGMAYVLETFLHDTNNYKGYAYLFDWNSMPQDKAKSIRYNRKYN